MSHRRSLTKAQRRAIEKAAQVAREVEEAIKLAKPFSKRPVTFSPQPIGPESTAWVEGERYPRFLLHTSSYGIRSR
jgi:hypothetical protein